MPAAQRRIDDEAADDEVHRAREPEDDPPSRRDLAGFGSLRVHDRSCSSASCGQDGERDDEGKRARVLLHERFQYVGPIGSWKSDCATTKPSLSIAMGSCGS